MRYFLLALLFSGAIYGLIYALEPTKGNITDQKLLSEKEKNLLRKLPRP